MTYNWEQAAASTLANAGADAAEVVEVLGISWCCQREKVMLVNDGFTFCIDTQS